MSAKSQTQLFILSPNRRVDFAIISPHAIDPNTFFVYHESSKSIWRKKYEALLTGLVTINFVTVQWKKKKKNTRKRHHQTELHHTALSSAIDQETTTRLNRKQNSEQPFSSFSFVFLFATTKPEHAIVTRCGTRLQRRKANQSSFVVTI